MRFIVGVMPLFDEQKNSIWMLPNYLEMLEKYNLVPFIFPYTTNKALLKTLLQKVDGLLFTGGHDVHPSYYGKDKLAQCGSTLHVRDELEKYAFEYAIEHDVPILGICRGIQVINALYGGTLFQDLPSQWNSSICHSQKPPYHVPVHRVNFPAGSDFSEWLSVTEYSVNSFHHQAIDKLAPNTEVLAISEDGLVEAIKLKRQSFAYAVQWHPEYLNLDDQLTKMLVNEFYGACLDYNYVKDK